MKAKTRKELEEKGKSNFRWVVFYWVVGLLFATALMASLSHSMKLQTQLSECQEQVPVWTLKFVCYEEDIKITFEQNYTDYEEYNWALELIGDSDYKLFENCEVLK